MKKEDQATTIERQQISDLQSKYDVDIGGLQGTLEVVYFSPAVSNFIIATFIACLLTVVAIFVKSKLKSGNKGA